MRAAEEGRDETPDEQRQQEPCYNLTLWLEERHRKRVEVEPIEAKRDHQVEVVEHLEYDEDGKQLEEVLSTPLIQVGWREMARDQAEARQRIANLLSGKKP